MKKIITALIVALGLSGSIQAQELRTDIPPFPTVKTQVSFTQKGEGEVKITNGNKATLATGSNTLVDYGVSQTFTLTPAKGNKVKSLVINGIEETLENGTSITDGVLQPKTYTHTTGFTALSNSLVATFVEKDTIQVMVSNTTQTENSVTAVTVTTVPAGKDVTIKYVVNKSETAEVPSTAGTYTVKITRAEDAEYKAVSETATLTINAKKNVDITTALPTASGILQGQPLSASILTGGVAKYTETAGGTPVVVPGTFTWEKPSLIASEIGTDKSFNVLFTPTQSDVYNSQLVPVKVAVTAVYTVTTSVTGPQGCGSILIENATMDNRYVTGTTLTVKAIPNAGYKLTGLTGVETPNSITDPFTTQKATYTVTADKLINATFEKRSRVVNFSSSNGGTLSVWIGDKEIVSGASVDLGTELTVKAKAVPTFALAALTVTDGATTAKQLTGTALKVLPEATDAAVTLAATFASIAVDYYTINLNEPKNGSVKLICDGAEIPVGAQLKKGAKVTVEAVPNTGYLYQSMSITGEQNVNQIHTISGLNENKTITANFTKQSYNITKLVSAGITLTINGLTSLTTAPYDEELTIVATNSDADNYKMTALMVDNQIVGADPLTNTYKVKIKGAMRIDAQSVALTRLSIANKDKTVSYNGSAQTYEVSANIANVAGYKVTYKQAGTAIATATATDAGAYSVYVERAADDVFAKLTSVYCGLLTIEPADVAILTEPTISNSVLTNGKASTEGAFSIESTSTDGNWSTILFTPKDTKNYKKAHCVIPTGSGIQKVGLTLTLGAGKKSTFKAAVGATSAGGVLIPYNENSPIGENAWPGGTITLKPVAEEGFTFIGWGNVEITKVENSTTKASTSSTLNPATNGTVTMGIGATTFKVTPKTGFTALFEKKTMPTPTAIAKTSVYNGQAQSVTVSSNVNGGWKVTYKQTVGSLTSVIPTPINVGTYNVWLQRDATDREQAYPSQNAGTLTITKATVLLTAPTASEISPEDKLEKSQLTGGTATYNGNQAVAGSFAWTDAAGKPTSGKSSVQYNLADEVNFTKPANLTIPVQVTTAAKYLVTYATPENGTLTVKDATGANVVSGSAVAPGTKLTITAAPAANYEVNTYDVNGSRPSSGLVLTYEANTNVLIIVTFKKIGEPVKPIVKVTGVSLNKTAVTLAIGKTVPLTATVKPAEATVKDVRWTNTKPAVASFDEKTGVVKALKAGTTTIVVTTVDGGFTAMCEVTVPAPTDVEKILSDTRVYAQDGAICIDPSQPVKVAVVNMLGAAIYHGQIAGAYRIATASGVYLVKLSDGKNEALVKVYVR